MASDSACRLTYTLMEAVKTMRYGIDDLKKNFDSQYNHLMRLQKDFDYMRENVLIATDLIKRDTPLNEHKLRDLENIIRHRFSSQDPKKSKIKLENMGQNQAIPTGLSKMNNHSDKMFNHSCNKDRFFENMYTSVNLEFEKDYCEANIIHKENMDKTNKRLSLKDETLRKSRSKYEDRRKRRRSVSDSRKWRPRTPPEILNTSKWNENEKVRQRIEKQKNFDRKYKKLCTPPIIDSDDKLGKYSKSENNCFHRTQSSNCKLEPLIDNSDNCRKSQFSEQKILASEYNDKNSPIECFPHPNYSEKLSMHNCINSLNDDSNLMYQDHFKKYVNGLCSEDLKNKRNSEYTIDHSMNRKNEAFEAKNIDKNCVNAPIKQYKASEFKNKRRVAESINQSDVSEPKKQHEVCKSDKHCEVPKSEKQSKKDSNLILLPEKSSSLDLNETNKTPILLQNYISKEENQIQLKKDDKRNKKDKSPRLYHKSKLKLKSKKKITDNLHINMQSTVNNEPVNKNTDYLIDHKASNSESNSDYVNLQAKIEQKIVTNPCVTKNVDKEIADTVSHTDFDNRNTSKNIILSALINVRESKIIPEQSEMQKEKCNDEVIKENICAPINTELKNSKNNGIPKGKQITNKIQKSSTDFSQNIAIEPESLYIDMSEKQPSNANSTNLFNEGEQKTSHPEENSNVNCQLSKSTTSVESELLDSGIENTNESVSSPVIAGNEHVKSIPKINKSKVTTRVIDENTISVTLHRRRARIIKG